MTDDLFDIPPVLTPTQVGALMSPLGRNRVAHRQQAGRQLSYVEAWDIKAALIRIFGFTGFSAECINTNIVRIDETTNQAGKPQFVVLATCTVRLTIPRPDGRDATYTETAAASQKGPDIGEVTDFAIKTAESDALKRAATYLGTQFGLSLYNNGTTEDVVRVILEPEQKSALETYREERRVQQEQVDADVQAKLARATGAAEHAADVEQQAQAGEETQ